MTSSIPSIPRIACFHGGGSSAAIFQVQCSKLQSYLETTYEFVFFNAPFFCEAGPGVLPYFTYEEYGPFRTWFAPIMEGAGLSGDPTQTRADGGGRGLEEGGIKRVLNLLRAKGDGGEWVGCMGFSQGTRVVGGLLREQQRRRELGLGSDDDIEFRFGVLCMGSAAPMTSTIGPGDGFELIKIPTLHVHGTRDKWYANGKKQLEAYYEANATTVWDVDYHHAMPWTKADVEHLVMLMKGMQRYM